MEILHKNHKFDDKHHDDITIKETMLESKT